MSRTSKCLLAEAKRIAQDFDVPSKELANLTDYFVKQLNEGLKKDCSWQIPSYVTKLPNGSETGTFLAIDLGGTNCRICSVELHGNSTFSVAQSKKTVPASVRVNPSYQPLFAFIASHLAEFLISLKLPEVSLNTESKRNSRVLDLAFTFSFTCEQTSLARGTLIHWDKGWDIPSAIGKDPCEMLQEAVDSMGLPVNVSVLANDSVGTLMAGSYSSGRNGRVLAGLIFGTGTNAAYVEKLSRIQRLFPEGRRSSSRNGNDIMVVNTEWGTFGHGTRILPTTIFDDQLDADSTEPGQQLLEKRVSALYLGEILRLVLLHLQKLSSFDMRIPQDSLLFRPGGMGGLFLSSLAQCTDDNLQDATGHIARALLATQVSLDDARAVRLIASAIVRRAARLGGASLAAIIIQSDRLNSESASNKAEPQLHTSRTQSSQRGRLIGNLLGIYRYVFRYLRRTVQKSGLAWLLSSLPFRTTASVLAPAASEDSFEGNAIGVGVDGSLFEYYPTFEAEMRRALQEIPRIGPAGEKRIRLTLAKDGSGVGAALIAQANAVKC